MKTILTGTSGFVGQHLLTYLNKQNIGVQALSLRDEHWKTVMDKQADALIHLAGKAHNTNNSSAPEMYFNINLDLTIALFNEFLNSEIRDFFYFSSVKAVADTVDGILVEAVNGNPSTPYGKSKLGAEQYLLAWPLPTTKRLFIIRPCMIHGPGNKGNLNLLYKVLEKGTPWPLAAFENHRSFLSIANLNFLIYKMLTSDNIPDGVYNFADDETLSTNELVNLISSVTGKKARLWHISKRLIEKIAAIGDKIKLPLNTERLKKLTESYIVNNAKIKIALKIDRLPVSAEEGVIATIKSLKVLRTGF